MRNFINGLFGKKKESFSYPFVLTTDSKTAKDGMIRVSGNMLSSVAVEALSEKNAVIYHTDDFENNHHLRTIAARLQSWNYQYETEIKSVSFIRQKNNIADSYLSQQANSDKRRNSDDQISPNTSTFDSMLKRAITLGSSDLRFHVRPDQNTCAITHKIDNRLVPFESISFELGNSIIAHAFSNLADQTSHEKGKTSFSPSTVDQGCTIMRVIDGEHYKLRYKSIPEASGGYDVTMRIQPQNSASGEAITLESLNLPVSAIKALKRSRRRRSAVIACGRVGVGKTTTLYALMQRHTSERDSYIGTIEDPVEYKLFGATQINVDKIGHAEAMRSVLRLGFDEVLVGEIRDHEMGGMFIEAQSTGQKIFTTTHETTAFGAFSRLTDETVRIKPSSLYKTNIIGLIFAQELLPKLCPDCKIPATKENLNVDDMDYYTQLVRLHIPTHNVFRRNHEGCSKCNKGSKGRVPLIEIIETDEKLMSLLRKGLEDEAHKYWRSHCTTPITDEDIAGKPMVAQGLYRVYKGELDIEEVDRISAIPISSFIPTVAAPASIATQVKVVHNAA